MDGTEVINQALASIIDTELVAKQLEQAFKDVSIFIVMTPLAANAICHYTPFPFSGNSCQCFK